MTNPSPLVEVHQPSVPSMGAIPQVVKDRFAEQGKVVSLRYAAPMAIGQAEAYQVYALLHEDLDEECWMALLRSGYRKREDGAVGKGDCILFLQDAHARDQQWVAERQLFNRMQHEQSEWPDEHGEELARRTGGLLGLSSLGVPHHVEKTERK